MIKLNFDIIKIGLNLLGIELVISDNFLICNKKDCLEFNLEFKFDLSTLEDFTNIGIDIECEIISLILKYFKYKMSDYCTVLKEYVEKKQKFEKFYNFEVYGKE